MFISTRLMKFLAVGGLNTLFGFGIYSLFALTSLPTWAVLAATNLITIVFNFFTTGGLVFRERGVSKVPRFLACYAIIFVTYFTLIESLSSILGGRILTMAAIILPVTALSYYLQSRFVFISIKK